MNELALGFYGTCTTLGPALALALDDLRWHPDHALLARQLAVIAAGHGDGAAPWVASQGPA
jgi:hypothetical protein